MVVFYLLSCVWLFVTLWTVTHQIPLSMGFSRQEYWNGLLLSSQEDLPDPSISCLAGGFFTTEPLGKLETVNNHFTIICISICEHLVSFEKSSWFSVSDTGIPLRVGVGWRLGTKFCFLLLFAFWCIHLFPLIFL